MKKDYSFLSEMQLTDVLSVAGAATLGSSISSATADQIANGVSFLKNNSINNDNINWYDPEFLSIIRQDLMDAKNNIKLAKEWYDSCDVRDKYKARYDYKRAIDFYRKLQKEISDRDATRWLPKYKEIMKKKRSSKYKKIGKYAGLVGGGGLAALSLKRK